MTQEQRIRALGSRINKIYAQAEKELTEKVDSFFADFERLDKKQAALVKAGKLSEDEYKKWRKNKLLMGENYKNLRDNVGKTMLEANKTAAAYINREMIPSYMTGFNTEGKDVSEQVKGYSFDLIDEDAVKRLTTSNKTILPYKIVDGRRDVRWNTKHVNSAILQGIIQGESIPKIAKRLEDIAGMNKDSAKRNARTAITGAHNSGRQDCMDKLAKDGVIIQKEWLATTGDSRTRDAHIELHHVIVDHDKPFENSIGRIMFPGDPNAHPANVYNCRCTIATVVKGFRKPEAEDSPDESELFQYGTAVDEAPEEYRSSLYKDIDNAPDFIRDTWSREQGKMSAPRFDANPEIGDAYFDPEDGMTHYVSKEKAFEQSSYQEPNAVFFHEYGHNIDYNMGTGSGYLSSQFEDGVFPDTIIRETEKNLKDFYADSHPEWLDPDKVDFFDMQKSYFKPEWYSDPQEAFEGQLRGYLSDIREEIGREQAWEIRDMLREASGNDEKLREIFETRIAPTETMQKRMKEEMDEFRALRREPYREGNVKDFIASVKENFNIYERSDISDMFDAYFSVNVGIGGGLGVGHGKAYFSSLSSDGVDITTVINKRNLATEAFAEMFSATATNNSSLPTIKTFFPESYEIFKRMLGGK